MSWLLAATIVGVVLAPHLLPQERLAPLAGTCLWLATLVLRAALAVLVATSLIFYVPATALFQLVTHWCIHAVVPFVSTHLGFSGHQLGDAATLVPALVLSASALSGIFGIWQGARAVKRWLGRGAVGQGPDGSVIVGGPEIVVAAAGLRSPRIVVSAGALTRFDDAELRAGLEHERGHISRRHRFLALVAQLALALGRLVPGSKRASAWVDFHLERDADAYALKRTGDPMALASAICKSAETKLSGVAIGWASLAGGGPTTKRLQLLVAGAPAPSRVSSAAAWLLTAIVVTSTVALVLSASSLASVALGDPGVIATHDCPG